MFNRTKLLYAATAVLAFGLLAYALWFTHGTADRQTLLRALPGQAHSILYIDFDGLRSAPFLAELLAWAPKPETDPGYEQFRRDTGFDYEKDLDRVALAFDQQGASQIVYAVAAGRFDHKKMAAYAARSGPAQKTNGREVYSVPVSGTPQPMLFAFLRSNLIALTNGGDLRPLLEKSSTAENSSENADWLTHFARLAGSPLFVVLRNDGLQQALGAAQAPSNPAQRPAGGFASPQLFSLLRQMQWVTIAGKPEGDHLRVVAEGESSDETVLRQLNELLNGITLLASAGLNDPKTRQQLPAATRDSYRDLLKSVDITRVDRGETKSLRLIFDLSPQLLKAAQPSLVPPPSQPSPAPATLPPSPPRNRRRP